MNTLLVTGGCGFIGGQFIRLILSERTKLRVVNLDLLTYAGNVQNLATVERRRDANAYRFIHGDVADYDQVRRIFEEERIDAIVNFAAETHVDRSLLDSAPFLHTNVEGVRVLLELARLKGVERFLQVSTDEVYGALTSEANPFSELSPLEPNSPYAASKAAADLFVLAYHKNFGVPVLTTRSGNNYGPYQFPEKFLPLFITNALENQKLPLYGDGQQVRDWIHVEDHTRAILLVLESGVPGEVYNVSAGDELSNVRMAERILDLVGKPYDLIKHVEDRLGHDRRYSIDASKLRETLGWRPLMSLEVGLSSTVAWYRANREWWVRVKSGEYERYYTRQYGKRLHTN